MISVVRWLVWFYRNISKYKNMFKRYSVRSALGNAKQWSVCLQIASIYRSRRVIFSNFYRHVSNEYGFHMCICTVCAHFTLPFFHILNFMPVIIMSMFMSVFAMPAASRFTCPDVRVCVLRFLDGWISGGFHVTWFVDIEENRTRRAEFVFKNSLRNGVAREPKGYFPVSIRRDDTGSVISSIWSSICLCKRPWRIGKIYTK